MNDSTMAIVLWAAGFLLNTAVLVVLLFKKRYRTVPWFTTWMATEVVLSIAAFLAYRYGSRQLYAVVYWTSDFADVLLQIAVVLEIAGYALKRSGRWVEGARLRLVLMGALAPLVALVMAWLMKPVVESGLEEWEARLSLFTTILVLLLFSAVVITSQQLALGLRSHVMRESYGFIVWNVIAFATDSLKAYWRTLGHFSLLEDVRIGVFQACLVYWCVAFWFPEPAVENLPPELLIPFDDLASRLEYAQSNRASRTGVAPK